MKQFKQKYLKGIKIIQFVDENVYDHNPGFFLQPAVGIDLALIIICDEYLDILIIKNNRIKEFYANKFTLPLLQELYGNRSSKHFTKYINNQEIKKGIYKITLKEFFERAREEKLGIHCDTEEKALKLLNEFNKLGKTWLYDEGSYLNQTRWSTYKNKTVYINYRMVGNIDRYYMEKTPVYEFEDIIFEDEE